MRSISLLFVLLGLLSPQLRAAEANASFRAGDAFDWRLTGMPPDVIQDIAALRFTIGQDGTVNLPLIGKMRAAGLSPTQLEDAIQAKFVAGKIFTKPTVIINPEQGQRSVSMSGGVRQPGRQLWSSDLTLSSAIGNAGDIDEFASGKNIRVVRDGKVFGIYNLKEISKDPARDPKLLPGDQVVVPK